MNCSWSREGIYVYWVLYRASLGFPNGPHTKYASRLESQPIIAIAVRVLCNTIFRVKRRTSRTALEHEIQTSLLIPRPKATIFVWVLHKPLRIERRTSRTALEIEILCMHISLDTARYTLSSILVQDFFGIQEANFSKSPRP